LINGTHKRSRVDETFRVFSENIPARELPENQDASPCSPWFD
jgi:hypothetical protein